MTGQWPVLVLVATVVLVCVGAVFAAVKVRELVPRMFRFPITLCLAWILAALFLVSGRGVSSATFASGRACTNTLQRAINSSVTTACTIVPDGASVAAVAVWRAAVPQKTLAGFLVWLMGQVAPTVSLRTARLAMGVAAFFAVPVASALWRWFGATVLAMFAFGLLQSGFSVNAALHLVNLDWLLTLDALQEAVSLLLLPERRFVVSLVACSQPWMTGKPVVLIVLTMIIFLAYRLISWAEPFVLGGATKGVAWHLATVGAVVIVRETLSLGPDSPVWLAMPVLMAVVRAMWDDRPEGSGIPGALRAARGALVQVLGVIGSVLIVPMHVWMSLGVVGLLPGAATAEGVVSAAMTVRYQPPCCAPAALLLW